MSNRKWWHWEQEHRSTKTTLQAASQMGRIGVLIDEARRILDQLERELELQTKLKREEDCDE